MKRKPKYICKYCGKQTFSKTMCGTCRTKYELVRQLLTMVKERKKIEEGTTARWISGDYGELSGTDAPLQYKCSKCGYAVVDDENFCPNCGKQMKRKVVLKNVL